LADKEGSEPIVGMVEQTTSKSQFHYYISTWKIGRKPDILSRESGDSAWEGEMKYRQNRECILLSIDIFQTTTAEVPAETLEVNTAKIIRL
jgi:hypothetical protein